MNTNRAEVFQASKGRVYFRRLFPIRKERAKRDQNKYCRYHRNTGITPTTATSSRMRWKTSSAKGSSATTSKLPARTKLARDLLDHKPSYHLPQRYEKIFIRYMEDRT